MLDTDGRGITAKFGKARPLGNHYKLVSYNQNLDNTTLENNVGVRHPFYLKTNTFVLTDEFIKENPKLAPYKKSFRNKKKSYTRFCKRSYSNDNI